MFPSDRAHFTATLWLWHTLPVAFWFVVYTVCDACPRVFRRFKIQQKQASNVIAMDFAGLDADTRGSYRVTEAQRRTFWKSLLHVLVQHCVTIPLIW